LELADRIVVFGLILLMVGVFIVAYDPVNVVLFTRLISGPTDPVGTVISLSGLSLAIAGGYRKLV
jgi:hypothetical protein